MIEFRCSRRDKTNTPVLYNEEVRAYAEALVGDYKPALLKEPGKVNGIHFIESYLGATVDYQDIYYSEGSSPIAGATVFNDDRILVFDREGLCVNTIDVSANTIILDNATVADGKEGYTNFTALHEGGHFCIHPAVYRQNTDQISFFAPSKEGKSVVCCRKADICGDKQYRRPATFTPEMTREHQANVFAAFVAMPRQTFIPYAKELARAEGFGKDGILVDYDDWESNLHIENVINTLMDTYGVSFTATKIHLTELGLLMNHHLYEEQFSQLSMTT